MTVRMQEVESFKRPSK